MIYICDAQGNAVGCIPQHVVQGSGEACVLTVAAPVAESAQLSVSYRLPSGTGTEKQVLTCIGLLEGVQGEGGIPLYGWRGPLPASVTAHYGTVAAQFSFLGADGSVQAGAPVLFTVERGVAAELPAQPSSDVYEQILEAIAQVKADVVAANFAARSLYAYREGTVYSAGEIVYCPEAAVYGTFVRSLISDNAVPPYSQEGVLNGSAWEEVCTFQDVYTQASAAKESADKAKISEDAALVWEERAAYFGESAELQANIASEAAMAAMRSQNETYASERIAKESAEAAAESAAAAQAAASSALSYNYQYESYDSLPRPGSTSYLYMIPSGSGEAGEEYDEYAWSEQKNNYERIGSAVKKADLSDFITKEFANSIVCTAAPVQTESVPAAGAALSVAVSSFARTPQEGDCFSALCKYGQTEKLYYVCAKILSVSASAVQAQVISSVGFEGADAAEIVLTEEQIAQYESADRDTTITLSSDVDGTKKFVLLDLGRLGRAIMTGAQGGYTATFSKEENVFVCLTVQGNQLFVRFLFALAVPESADAGKIPAVNGTGSGYTLVSSVARADEATRADTADLATTAQSATTAASATNAGHADEATHAETAGSATTAQSATNAAHADEATHADTADSATTAQSATTAESATNAQQLGGVAASDYALRSQLPEANPAQEGTEELSSVKIGGSVYKIAAGSGGGEDTVDLGEFDASVSTSQNGGFTTTVPVDVQLQEKLSSARHVSFTVVTAAEGITLKQKYTIPVSNSMEITGYMKAASAMGLVDVSGGDNLEPYDHGYTIGRFRPSNDDGSEYGLTVYGIEDNPRLRLPYPYSYDSGKVPVVRSDGTGYELQSGVARMYRHHIYILDEDRYLELISTSSKGIQNFSELKEEEIILIKVITDMGQSPVFPVVAYNLLSEDQLMEIYYINAGVYDMLTFAFDMAVEDSVASL